MERSTTSTSRLPPAAGGGPALLALARTAAVAAILYPLCHAAALCLRMAFSCPEGAFRPLAFSAVAAATVFGPGLALLRLTRLNGPARERLLLALSGGISATGLFLWLACLAGALCVESVAAWILLCAASLCREAFAFLRHAPPPGGAVRRLWAKARRTPVAELFRAAVASALACAVFEASVGVPFLAWDAAVSWDKWAVDFASRNSMGGYLTGGYPPFLPLLGSMFYRIAGSAGDVLPPEQLLLHGLFAIFPAALMLALSCLGARHRFSGLAAFLLFASSQYVFGDLAIGQADVPLLAMLLSAAALVPRLAQSGGGRAASSAACALLLFAAVFTKGTGAGWALFAAIYCDSIIRKEPGTAPARLAAATGFLAAILLALPFALKSVVLSLHPELVDRSPFLLVFPLKAAHTGMFTPDLAHLLEWLGRMAFDRIPFGRMQFRAVAAGVPAAVLLAAALLSRRARGLALFSAATLAAWFLLASYDLRNAEAPLCLLAIAAAMPLRDAAAAAGRAVRARRGGAHPSRMGGLAFHILVASSWCALSLPGLAGAPLRAVAALASPPRPPAAWTGGFPARLRLMKPASDLVNILDAAPYGRRARHVVACDRLYRLFGKRGVYGIQLNWANGISDGDIYLRCPAWAGAPGAPFVRAATLERVAPYRELWLACAGGAVESPAFSVAEGTLDIAGAPPCGLLEVRLPAGSRVQGESPISISCANAAGEAALFAKYVKPAIDGDVLRLLYWTGSGAAPAFGYSGPAPEAVAVRPMP